MSRFSFVDREKAAYPVSLLCSLLRVSRSGYYAWARRRPSARSVADAVLAEQIKGFHAASRKTYGAPRIWLDLRDAGVRVGRKRVARLMREHHLAGACRRSFRHATKADPAAAPAADLLERDFTATAPNQKWVADVTYVPTVQGWLYLATVLDVYSRRIVGWSIDAHRKTRLVCDAVAMAAANRGGKVAGVIHHSDRGGEYTSRDLELALRRHRALASMGSVADCYDNSMAESFFATLETELFWAQPRRRFDTHREAKLAVFDYIEVFYNRRRHTAIGGVPPVTYEAHAFAAGDVALAAGSFVLSYDALHQLAVANHVPRPLAWIWPLIVDGFVIVASLAILHAVQRRRTARYPWALLIGFSGLSVIFNVLHAAPTAIARLVAAIPPLTLVLSFELLMRQLRYRTTPQAPRRRPRHKQRMTNRLPGELRQPTRQPGVVRFCNGRAKSTRSTEATA